MKYLLLISLLILPIKSCKAKSSFKYKDVPAKHLPNVSDLNPFVEIAGQLNRKTYDLTQALPKGYVKDASIDYTSYIQKAINKYDTVSFPNFPLLISSRGLHLKSNSTLIFPKENRLTMEPNDKLVYAILNIYNKKNITIYFPVIKGERYKHKSIKGAWGMGIFIRGSNNIKVINPVVSNCWGDGIYIGQGETHSSDVQIYYPVLDNNRRNGISIVSATNVLIEAPVVSNTNGTKPASGIDVEPNTNDNKMDEIVINNPITFNSQRFGILVYLEYMRGKLNKEVNLTINNPIDLYSLSSFRMGRRKKNFRNKSKIRGSILISNPQWMSKGIIPQSDSYTPKVIIESYDPR